MTETYNDVIYTYANERFKLIFNLLKRIENLLVFHVSLEYST